MNHKTFTVILYSILVGGVFFVWSSFQEVRGENIFIDSDQDGLSNEEERLYKTNSEKRDTDGDGYSDGVEVKSGYDPLKPAPGDKLFAVASNEKDSDAQGERGQNLTENFSEEIADVITKKTSAGEDVSLEELDQKVNELLSGKGAEVVLPPIDVKGLKIKNPVSDKLSPEEKKQKEKDQAVKYLTAMAYIAANNTPQKFTTEEELGVTLTTLSGQVAGSLGGSNKEIITLLADNGRKTLEQAKDVEIPSHMLGHHIKALQLAEYAISLEDEVKQTTEDPLGEVAVMMKVQSLLSATLSYVNETEGKMKEYGITDLPIEL